MKINNDYWTFGDGSCYDITTGNNYNSTDAMFNGRISDSYDRLYELTGEVSERKPINLTELELNIYKRHFINKTWKTEHDKKIIIQINEKLYGEKARKIIFEGCPILSGNKVNFWLYEEEYNKRTEAEDCLDNLVNKFLSWFK